MTKEDFCTLRKYNMYHLCRVSNGTVTSDIVFAKSPKGAKFFAMWNKIKFDFILETKLVKINNNMRSY